MCEDVAAWWQVGFPDGAAAEYEEQILPLLDKRRDRMTKQLLSPSTGT